MKYRTVIVFFILFMLNNIYAASGAEITVKTPNGGGILVDGAFTNITWTTEGTVNNVNIDLTIDNGASWDIIAANLPNNGSYAWTVPGVTSDSCKIKVSDVTTGGPSDESDSVFSIKQIRFIKVTAPNGGESFKVGTKQTIKWDTYGIIDSVRIELSQNDGKSWIIFTSKTQNKGTYNFYVPDIVSKQCKIKVSNASDTSVSDMSDSPFSIHNPNIAILHYPGIPKISALTNIGPNPIRKNLYIDFSIAQRGNILIEIYSSKGQMVKCLANEIKDAGFYKLLWNGTDYSGKQVSTGSYILKLCIGSNVYTKLLTIIK